MGDKTDVIYPSSKDALMKFFVLFLTIGISIFASFLEDKSCYITVLVQACNNMYDFYKFTDNTLYTNIIKREAITIVFVSIIDVIVSIIALLNTYNFITNIWMKLFSILLITIPLIVVYSDYRINIKKENREEV